MEGIKSKTRSEFFLMGLSVHQMSSQGNIFNFLFYAAPLLFQVDAVKEQVKAKCSVFVLEVFSLEDCGLECAWF